MTRSTSHHKVSAKLVRLSYRRISINQTQSSGTFINVLGLSMIVLSSFIIHVLPSEKNEFSLTLRGSLGKRKTLLSPRAQSLSHRPIRACRSGCLYPTCPSSGFHHSSVTLTSRDGANAFLDVGDRLTCRTCRNRFTFAYFPCETDRCWCIVCNIFRYQWYVHSEQSFGQLNHATSPIKTNKFSVNSKVAERPFNASN